MGKSGGGSTGTQRGLQKYTNREQRAQKRDAIDYIKALEQQPLDVRGQALGGLQNLFMGDQSYQNQMIQRAQGSPLYGAIMSGQNEAEDAIMRNAAMTGGLRSGNVQTALSESARDFQTQALLQSYNQQLQGLGGLAQAQGMPTQLANLLGINNAVQAGPKGESGGGFSLGGMMSGVAMGSQAGLPGMIAGGALGGFGG